ncbi:MAG: hypothetical protein WCR21_10105 [Bacteroidota bacterium]
MKNFFQLSIVLLCVALFSACASIRLTETESSGKNTVKDGVSENEDLRISYDFWGEHGLMYFIIYNKSKKPIYIDWKKSVYVHNQWKNDYWIEQTTSESITVPIGDEKSRSFRNVMSSVVAERITFLPPDCYIAVPMTFEILDHLNRKQQLHNFRENKIIEISDNLKWDENAKKEVIQKPGKKGSFKAYTLNYTKENSPYRFRNFITYSSDEKFSSEKSFDNEFFVKRFVQMNGFRFFGKAFVMAHKPKPAKRLKNGLMKVSDTFIIYDSPFRKSTSFYKTL